MTEVTGTERAANAILVGDASDGVNQDVSQREAREGRRQQLAEEQRKPPEIDVTGTERAANAILVGGASDEVNRDLSRQETEEHRRQERAEQGQSPRQLAMQGGVGGTIDVMA